MKGKNEGRWEGKCMWEGMLPSSLGTIVDAPPVIWSTSESSFWDMSSTCEARWRVALVSDAVTPPSADSRRVLGVAAPVAAMSTSKGVIPVIIS